MSVGRLDMFIYSVRASSVRFFALIFWMYFALLSLVSKVEA